MEEYKIKKISWWQRLGTGMPKDSVVITDLILENLIKDYKKAKGELDNYQGFSISQITTMAFREKLAEEEMLGRKKIPLNLTSGTSSFGRIS